MPCYLDGLNNINDIEFESIVFYGKSDEGTFPYYFGSKPICSVMPLRLTFHKTKWYIKDYKGGKCLALLCSKEKEKDLLKNMKKYFIKLNILLKLKIRIQIIMLKNTWKSELI